MTASDRKTSVEPYRLQPRQLNLLLNEAKETFKKLAAEIKATDDAKEQPFLNVTEGALNLTEKQHSYNVTVNFFTVEKEYDHVRKKFTIFQVVKDSANQDNESGLAFLGDVLDEFRKNFPDDKSTLLFPTRQCRGWIKLPVLIAKREHIALVEINASSSTTHDSQSKWLSILYPDKLNELATKLKLTNTYIPYNMQQGNFECGYFVYSYIRQILDYGNSQSCETIGIDGTAATQILSKVRKLADKDVESIEEQFIKRSHLSFFHEESNPEDFESDRDSIRLYSTS